MTLFRVTPASQPLIFQFIKVHDQLNLSNDPVPVLLNDLTACAVRSDSEWVAPLTSSTNIYIVFLASTVNNGRHGLCSRAVFATKL